jgi:uncharacterized paraquat-inducible protein A
MAVFCPQCGHVLKTSERSGASKGLCRKCARPLGVHETPRRSLTEHILNVLFLRSIPYEVAFIVCGILLFILAMTVFFPVWAMRALNATGLAAWMNVTIFAVRLDAVDTLMLLTGLSAMVFFIRLLRRTTAWSTEDRKRGDPAASSRGTARADASN